MIISKDKKTSLIRSFKRGLGVIGRIASVIVSIVLVVFMNMLKEVKTEDFNFMASLKNDLTSPFFWLTVMVINVSWLVIWINVYFFARSRLLQNPDVVEMCQEYKMLNKNRIKNIRDYIKIVNLKRKKTAYIDMMEDKLSKVQNKLEKIPLDKYNTKKYLELKHKEENIKNCMEDSYIDEHILYLSVDYNKVKIEDFTPSAISKGKTSDKTNSEESKILIQTLSGKFFRGIAVSLGMVSMIASISVYFSWKDSTFIIALSMMVISFFSQIYFASERAEKTVDEEIIVPTTNKIEILKDSMQWSNATQQDSEFNKIIEKYLESIQPKEKKEKIVITQKELEFLKEHQNEINQEDNNNEQHKD